MLALWMAYSSDLQALLQIQPETKEDHSRPDTRGKHVFQSISVEELMINHIKGIKLVPEMR